jgi:pyruvate kinase
MFTIGIHYPFKTLIVAERETMRVVLNHVRAVLCAGSEVAGMGKKPDGSRASE